MSRKFFGRILEGVCFHGTYFQCKPNAIGKIVFSSYQKCSAAIHMLASEVAGDLVDEYMSGSTCLDSMYKFCQAAVEVFSDVYMGEPNMEDTQ
jgi:hypothetical protein